MGLAILKTTENSPNIEDFINCLQDKKFNSKSGDTDFSQNKVLHTFA